ncbi:putative metal-binding motif-containing protein [Corallococcus sp. AB049A]|uniref:putative metal-binding motif-containing protein n=1 Tax=Corallococcus sp. AB049A TaxID=2316721 RepID=UPI0011C3C7D3|nr:putative metal-binding motif-containing protein [Corallococcus sp. AB049A]
MQSRMKSLVVALWLVGCGSSTSPSEPERDAGTQVDAGTRTDAGVTDDAGTPDSGIAEGLPCEKTQGVCAGAKRAWVDGAYEPVCTARSYGADYEASETRCDGLDNDCDGVTDPSTWTDVIATNFVADDDSVDSLPVAGGFLMTYIDSSEGIKVLRFDESLGLRGTSLIPLDAASSPITQVQLLRTSRGLALYFTANHSQSGSSFAQGHLVYLDEQGVPLGAPEGVVLFEQSRYFGGWGGRARVAASVDGARIAVVWNVDMLDVREVRGMIVDADGQVLAEPRALFKSDASHFLSPAVLGIEDGGFLITAHEDDGDRGKWWFRMRRWDRELGPVGEERVLPSVYMAIPKLLMAPGEAGGGWEPTLLYREPDGHTPRIHQLRSLFEPKMSETLTPVTWSQSAAFGATVTSRGLQLAWLATNVGDVIPSGPYAPWNGRLWGLSPSGVMTDWTPGPAPLPIYLQGAAVRLHELPGGWMGALLRTGTDNPRTYAFHSLRYCAP